MTILSPSEEKALRKQYYNESLFRNLAPVLKELVDQSNMKHISVVYIWKTASELCRELGQSACPEFEIKELLSDLKEDLRLAWKENIYYEIYPDTIRTTLPIIAVVVAMMLVCTHNDKYQETIDYALSFYRHYLEKGSVPYAISLNLFSSSNYAKNEAPQYDYTALPNLLSAVDESTTDTPATSNRLDALEKQVADLSVRVQLLEQKFTELSIPKSFADSTAHRRDLLRQVLPLIEDFQDDKGGRFLSVKANWYFILRFFAEQGLYLDFTSYQPFLDDLIAIGASIPDKLSKNDLAQKRDYLTPDSRFPYWNTQAGKQESRLSIIISCISIIADVLAKQ